MSDKDHPAVSFRLPQDLLVRIAVLAKKECRSLSNMLRLLVEKGFHAWGHDDRTGD